MKRAHEMAGSTPTRRCALQIKSNHTIALARTMLPPPGRRRPQARRERRWRQSQAPASLPNLEPLQAFGLQNQRPQALPPHATTHCRTQSSCFVRQVPSGRADTCLGEFKGFAAFQAKPSLHCTKLFVGSCLTEGETPSAPSPGIAIASFPPVPSLLPPVPPSPPKVPQQGAGPQATSLATAPSPAWAAAPPTTACAQGSAPPACRGPGRGEGGG